MRGLLLLPSAMLPLPPTPACSRPRHRGCSQTRTPPPPTWAKRHATSRAAASTVEVVSRGKSLWIRGPFDTYSYSVYRVSATLFFKVADLIPAPPGGLTLANLVRPCAVERRPFCEVKPCQPWSLIGGGTYAAPHIQTLADRAITGRPAPEKMVVHDAFTYDFFDVDAFKGEKWHADQAFKWLGDAAFGA